MTDRVVLPGLERYHVTEAMFEGLRVLLSHRGEPYTSAYIQGLSGAAFVVAGPCDCAPTCGQMIEPVELARALGYEPEALPFPEGADAKERATQEILARVKAEVRSGRPALVWHAFTYCEWDVVGGFDDRTGTFLGRGSYVGLGDDYVEAPQTRLQAWLEDYPSFGAILVGDRVREPDLRAAETTALNWAVEHARTPADRLASGPAGEWRFRRGLGCYDWWIAAFAEPERLPSNGDRYCLGIYSSTHRAAAAFVLELAAKHPTAEVPCRQAADAFLREAVALGACWQELFPGQALPDSASAERNQAAAALLAEARDCYAEAIDAVEAAAALMGSS